MTIMTLHSTSRKAYSAWHFKQKNVSGSNAYIGTSNISLLITLIQISVESTMMRHMLIVGLFRGCLAITFTLEYDDYEDYCLLGCNPV